MATIYTVKAELINGETFSDTVSSHAKEVAYQMADSLDMGAETGGLKDGDTTFIYFTGGTVTIRRQLEQLTMRQRAGGQGY